MKQSGLGDNFYVDGVDLSGDIASVDTISCPLAPLDTTALKQFAPSRIGGQRDGAMSFTSWFNYNATPPPQQEHNILNGRPTADRILSYWRGTAIGNPAASLNAKQLNYDPTRGNDGALSLKVDAVGSNFGLEWGIMLTPGIRTDTTATAAGPGNSVDTLASAAFGGQAYLQVFSVTGTSVTVSVWDSADNITFAAVAGFGFAAATPAGSPQAQRIAIANTATIRRYIAVATAGTFTNAQFAVMIHKNEIAGIVF